MVAPTSQSLLQSIALNSSQTKHTHFRTRVSFIHSVAILLASRWNTRNTHTRIECAVLLTFRVSDCYTVEGRRNYCEGTDRRLLLFCFQRTWRRMGFVFGSQEIGERSKSETVVSRKQARTSCSSFCSFLPSFLPSLINFNYNCFFIKQLQTIFNILILILANKLLVLILEKHVFIVKSWSTIWYTIDKMFVYFILTSLFLFFLIKKKS